MARIRGGIAVLASALLATSVLLGLSPVEAVAQMSLGDLEQVCTGTSDASATACRFFILGIAEASSTGDRPKTANAWPCIPEGIPDAAMVFIVKKAMGEDLVFFPQDRTLPAVSFVLAALAKQYPCK